MASRRYRPPNFRLNNWSDTRKNSGRCLLYSEVGLINRFKIVNQAGPERGSHGHVLPLFGPSLFIVKWLCFKLKNRAFRVIHYEHHICSESLHKDQSFKKIKMICHVSISKINFI